MKKLLIFTTLQCILFYGMVLPTMANTCFRHDAMASFLSTNFQATLKVRGEGVNILGKPMMMEIYTNDNNEYFTVNTTEIGVSCLVASGNKFTLLEDKGI